LRCRKRGGGILRCRRKGRSMKDRFSLKSLFVELFFRGFHKSLNHMKLKLQWKVNLHKTTMKKTLAFMFLTRQRWHSCFLQDKDEVHVLCYIDLPFLLHLKIPRFQTKSIWTWKCIKYQSLPSFFSPSYSKTKIFVFCLSKFFYNFHLSESSFTCPVVWTSGLVGRLQYPCCLYADKDNFIQIY
jgi:hypothetical protein